MQFSSNRADGNAVPILPRAQVKGCALLRHSREITRYAEFENMQSMLSLGQQ